MCGNAWFTRAIPPFTRRTSWFAARRAGGVFVLRCFIATHLSRGGFRPARESWGPRASHGVRLSFFGVSSQPIQPEAHISRVLSVQAVFLTFSPHPETEQRGPDPVSPLRSVHPLDVVLRACHAFTATCAVSARGAGPGHLAVELAARDANDLPPAIGGEFWNALIDAHLRVRIADETRAIRELLVAQAFCEADLLDRRESEGDEREDPRGIAR